jgi:hypothetical protein
MSPARHYPPELELGQDLARELGRAGGVGPSPDWFREMPASGLPRSLRESIVAPTVAAAQQVVIAHTVEENYLTCFWAVMNTYIGDGPFVEGSGGIIWTIDIDRDPAGVLDTGTVVQDFGSIKTRLGNLDAPWQLQGPILLRGLQTIRFKVQVFDGAIAAGGDNRIHCALEGWTCPAGSAY